MDRSPPPFFRQGPSANARLLFFGLLSLGLLIADARFDALGGLRQGIGNVLYPVQRVLLIPRDAIALAEGGGAVHVHQQPEQEADADADLARLVHVPEYQHQREEVRNAVVAPPRHDVEDDREQDGECDVGAARGQEEVFVARRHDGAPFALRAVPPRGSEHAFGRPCGVLTYSSCCACAPGRCSRRAARGEWRWCPPAG